jgi:RNA polymerase sigma-70 factor (ECF subfamily)
MSTVMTNEISFYANAGAGQADDSSADDASPRSSAQATAATVPRAASEIQLQTWIQRVTKLDEAAFAALYEACVGRVYGMALRITRNAALAEEVAEDAFWQLWREAPRFDPARGTAMAWLLTITRSRALDALRARDPAELVEDAGELVDTQYTQASHEALANPVDLLSATVADRSLHDALSKLDAQPRQLIALAFFKGLTHDEIAAHTGMPLGTVKSHIRRGLTALKTLLGDAAGRRPEGI